MANETSNNTVDNSNMTAGDNNTADNEGNLTAILETVEE